MKNKNRWSKHDLEQLPETYKRQIEQQLGCAVADLDDARNKNPKQKPDKLAPLEFSAPAAPGLVDIAGPLFVRITRQSPRPLDDDNLSGGCKQLRDAVAALLGRGDDSERSGMHWEYAQERGNDETRVEVWAED